MAYKTNLQTQVVLSGNESICGRRLTSASDAKVKAAGGWICGWHSCFR